MVAKCNVLKLFMDFLYEKEFVFFFKPDAVFMKFIQVLFKSFKLEN